MALYGTSVDAVALVAATAKSVLEIAVPSTGDAWIKEWWVEFDGVTASAVPVKVEVGRFTAAVTTATTITPFKIRSSGSPASGMTVKHSTSTEGAATATDVFIHRVPPTSGLWYVAPLGQEMSLMPSTWFRIRCTAAANVNVSFGCIWDE